MRRRGKLVIVPPMDYRVYVTPFGVVQEPCPPEGCADAQAQQARQGRRRGRAWLVPA
jgi:hypothetical protein